MVFWRRSLASCLAGILLLVFSVLLFSADNLQSAISATSPAKINFTEQKAAASRVRGSAVRMVHPTTCLRLTTAAEKDRKLRSLGKRESVEGAQDLSSISRMFVITVKRPSRHGEELRSERIKRTGN